MAPHAETRTVRAEATETLKVLVLETDDVFPETRERKGTFGQIFHALFEKAGKQHNPPLKLETTMMFVVEPEGGKVPDTSAADGFHAVLFSGSKHDAHGDDEWILKLVKWIQDLWKQRPDIRWSGVCFGHQILCRALGSTVEPSPGEEWELAHTKLDLTTIGERLFQTTEYIHLHQMHQDHVVNAPSTDTSSLVTPDMKIHVWASTEQTLIQGMYICDRLFTSQGHLGYDAQMVRLHIQERIKKGIVKDVEAAEEAKETADFEHDGLLVAGAILRFFHGDDVDIV